MEKRLILTGKKEKQLPCGGCFFVNPFFGS
jgi:hypothetical protein